MSRGSKASVILVEDNEALRNELALFLTDEGYAVRGVDCGSELNLALASGCADILILDLNLPEEEGISITRRIRSALPHIGIVILTARVRSVDRLDGYAAGADVFLTKPTRPDELIAVLNNLLVRIKAPGAAPNWQLDVSAMALQSPAGEQIVLTRAEVVLLREMALTGQCVEHDRLIALLGDDAQPEKVNKARIEVLISRLRSKLDVHASQGLTIRALRGQGYQLSLPLLLKNLPVVRESDAESI
ncbi:response regulator transcription factor [Lacisediminimonas sp.]|uniref:response regulator transcription factor n=1 Tax=Lacisediminimonas sp. TaxID=3060582 RepID=UPI00271AB879|nr:response regulator transcription factor [Lacisediminimonas sp.]MDO8300703.1 response regulator transcription factor [Lacisediminimonas sp.]